MNSSRREYIQVLHYEHTGETSPDFGGHVSFTNEIFVDYPQSDAMIIRILNGIDLKRITQGTFL